MSSAMIAKLGLIFLGLGLCATFLMYWLWGFPFDKATRTSAAPKPLMYTHRVLGYLFLVTYVAIMWHMVPRLWTYQVEFPARTVAHIVLGITVGFLLVIKISIMRFFRHFEEWMPYLGTAIMLCTVLLLGLSVPFVFQEKALAGSAPGGSVYSSESLERVARLLPAAGLPEEAPLALLASAQGLGKGRGVLLDNCVKCHDLRTILARPRTPSNWFRTVERMAEKPALFDPIEIEQQWQVTAYLVAITPDLQRSLKQIRSMEKEMKETLAAAEELSVMPRSGGEGEGAGAGEGAGQGEGAGEGQGEGEGEGQDEGAGQGEGLAMAGMDAARARAIYQEVCSACHELSDVDAAPPRAAGDIDPLMERMIENGMEVDAAQIGPIKWYLLERFVNKTLEE